MTKKTENKNNQTETTEAKLFADINVSMKSGHMVRDAETIADGRFVKLTIASNKQFLDSNKELQTNTNYFNALISSKLSKTFEKAQDFKKGDWVYIKGEDQTQSFDTPQGYRKSETTIFAYHVDLKKAKAQNSGNTVGEAAPEVA